MVGYLNKPEATGKVLRDGWYNTGDLGYVDPDGFLRITDRLSRFSKIGGEMVPHGTIEQRLVELFDLDQTEGLKVVVVGLPDPGKGEALVLLTTLDLTPEQIREKLADAGLPALWIPKIVAKVDRIPVLGTGKLDLKGCRDLAAAMTAGG